jgi:putative nucleotidyltransferase with HDIG domain
MAPEDQTVEALPAEHPSDGMDAHCRRVAAWSLALEQQVKGAKMPEILEIAEAMDQHFAWEPYAEREDPVDPAAAAALECLRVISTEDLDRAIRNLPVFPIVAQRALRVLMRADWSAAELQSIASSDQALATQLLAAANSWTGPARMRISTISQAITYIGSERTSRILYAASLKPLFSNPRLRELWMHSLSAAQAAESIAEATRSADPKESFLAGLIHDIGRLAMSVLPAAFQSRFESLTGAGCEPFLVERVLSGFSHAQAGARALREWKFPDPLVNAIEFHHEPEKTENKLASILFLVEHWTVSQEDMPSVARLNTALRRAGMTERELAQLVPKDDRSISGLRFS